MSAEEKKRAEEIAKENEKIGNLNAMLAQASEQQKAGNFDGAVELLQKVVAVDASKPVIWARLGDAELAAARKTADRSAQQEKLKTSMEAFSKALAPAPEGPGTLKPVDTALAYTEMGEAQARLGLDKDALDSCGKVVSTPELNASTCYFNVGAVLTNRGKVDDANTAFDKAIAADPARAEAYYQKALNLMGKATVDKEGKTTAPPEVATNLNKYLELAPNGPNAQVAKELLASLGAKVETTFGKRSTSKPVKK
jgi:tetratricopeptide (TPR) repeat protein